MSAITRLAFLTLVAVFGCAGVETCALAAGPAATSSGPTVGPVLENGSVALVFDRGSGSLVALRNKLAGETYSIRDDRFCITAEEFQIEQLAAKLVSVELQAESWKAKYEVGPLRAEVVYMLGGGHSFAQKRITLRVGRDCRLKKILVSRLAFSAPDLEIVRYRYPQFGRSPGTEPISTFFGRTPRGGFCTGLEMPFDASSLEDRQVALAYAPSLKIKAGEELACAPAYFGVYRRTPADDQPPANPPMRSSSVAVPPGTKEVLPLPSESEAMVATTSVRFARISPIGPGRARWTARRTSAAIGAWCSCSTPAGSRFPPRSC
ncbi:MAG: hypothetical protein ACLQNE_03525 [Thermoguttaceae bacterium]